MLDKLVEKGFQSWASLDEEGGRLGMGGCLSYMLG